MIYFFVINGRKDMSAMRAEIERQLENLEEKYLQMFQIETYVTAGVGDATRFVHVYCDLHPVDEVCFVACGGNGMINEVASGLVGYENKSMAVLAYGKCNDFVKYYPDYDFKSVEGIFQGCPTDIDILKVNDNYSINVCNFGFDSVVCSTANDYMDVSHVNPYRIGIIRALFTARFNRVDVAVDGEKIGGRRMLLCTLSNGRYVGGEFLCSPYALIDDGQIEVVYIKPMTLLSFVKMLPLYSSGSFIQNRKFARKLIYRRAKHVEIHSKHLIDLCLDGELLPGKKFNVDVLPKAIRLILPQCGK